MDESDESKPPECTETCCTDEGRRTVVWRAVEYGFVILPRDIGIALLVGVVIAGVIAALVPPNQWQPYLGGGIVSMVLMMALGIPIYVCASASVPIAAGLIHLGASPGAALAFLIAGPATNAATITTVWKLLGSRTAVLYLLTIAISAVGGGLLLDWLMPAVQPSCRRWPSTATRRWPDRGSRHFGPCCCWWCWRIPTRQSRSREPNCREASARRRNSAPAERLELVISGMTCGHCVAAVTRALAGCRGVAAVQVDLAAGRAVVAGEKLDVNELIAAVRVSRISSRARLFSRRCPRGDALKPFPQHFSHEHNTVRQHRLGRRRRLGGPRLPQLPHRAGHHLQRLSGARRKDGPDRHGQGPVCRTTAAQRGLAGRSRECDYVVCNHAEMDHAGALPEVMRAMPQATLLCDKKCAVTLGEHFDTSSWKIQTVASGETISLGRRTLQFLETPMVHWPESMFTYVPEDKLLFSMDAFGQHYATGRAIRRRSGSAHGDAGGEDLLRQHRDALRQGRAVVPGDSSPSIEIRMIAPSHGLIWRSHGAEIVAAYRDWANHRGAAEGAGRLRYDVGEHGRDGRGDRRGGHTAGRDRPADSIRRSNLTRIAGEVLDAAAVAFGSSTLNRGMMPMAAATLSYLEGLRPRNKAAWAFGSYGWGHGGPEAVDQALRTWNGTFSASRCGRATGRRPKFSTNVAMRASCWPSGRSSARLKRR